MLCSRMCEFAVKKSFYFKDLSQLVFTCSKSALETVDM